MLYARILAWLARRGITSVTDAFRLRDDSLGGISQPYIAVWDSARLGPQPSASNLASIPDEEARVAIRRQRGRDHIERTIVEALASAAHRRFRQFNPNDTMTAAQWEDLIFSEFERLAP